MARKSLKPQLNQIRTWVRQGRTDAWIAHQLQVTVRDIESFKRQHDLAPSNGDGEGEGFDADLDLRAEDDALVAEQLEAEPAEEAEADDEPESSGADDEDPDKPKRRRRGRRGGRGRKRGKAKPLEGTFDHGEEGYGLWLDPAVQDNGTYAEHWAGHRDVVVTIEADRIVITRPGEEPGAEGSEEPEES